MAEACHGADGNPGLELGLELGDGWAGRPRQGRRSTRTRAASASGSSSCSPSRPARTARAWSPRRRSRRTGPTARRPRSARRTVRARRRSSSAGSSRPRSPARSSASTRSTSPNVQAAKDRTHEVLAAGRRAGRRARRARSTSCSPQARPGDYVAIQAFVDPARGARARAARRARPRDRLRRHARPRPALPALDRAAAQGRAADRPASSRSSTTPATSSRSRAATFGFRRLIHAQAAGDLAVAQGARAAASSASDWRSASEARNGRPRPDGREHDEAAAQRHGHEVKTYARTVRLARRPRSSSWPAARRSRASSG